MERKKIGTNKAAVKHSEGHGVIEVMKPFVHFGVKAMAFLGSALVHIVKNVPKPDSKPTRKNNKIIKI
ncbi:hypothetical protein FFF34_008850 [Inquilinus sp. KBS0705]|nr:hypothetical protein FFF34_008850 [Inquilinus sp. KBS0705]